MTLTYAAALPLGEVTEQDDGSDDSPRRQISGRIAVYGSPGRPGGSMKTRTVTLSPGSLRIPEDLSQVKLLRDHDVTKPLGLMTRVSQNEDGVDADFHLGDHPAGIEALALAAEGILDGLSVGIEPTEWDENPADQSVTITAANLHEVSMVALPAYRNARTTHVAAATDHVIDTIEGNPTAMSTETISTSADDIKAAVDSFTEALRSVKAEQAPADAAPLLARMPDTTDSCVPSVTFSPVVDRDGYSRTLPAVVAGRDRVDASDYIAASCMALAKIDDGPWENVKRIMAAANHQTTDLVPGLLPQQIVGPILDRLASKRPVWNSLTPRAMPSTSKTFSRPRITQQVVVGKQTAEKEELVNQPMKIVLEEVAKETYGGYVNISRQVIDWTTPGAMEQILFGLTEQLVRQMEKRACEELVAAATTKIEGDLTDPVGMNRSIYAAAAAVNMANDASNTPADRIWMSPDMWEQIGSLADTTKRPLFPALNPSNALGSLRPSLPTGGDFGGLSVVVSGVLPKSTLIVGASEAIELYEDQRGTLQAVEPSVLGVQVAAYAYMAAYVAQGKELVSLVQKAPEPDPDPGNGDGGGGEGMKAKGK